MKFLIVLALAAIVYTANGAALQKRDLKSDLLARAATLDTQTKDEIKKLTDGGRAGEAAHLEREEKELQRLAQELKATPDTDAMALRRHENEVRAIEMRVAEELRRLERGAHRTTGAPATTAASLVKRDLKSTLLTRAATLETRTTDEIKKLTADGKERETALLKREERRLHELATELKAATTNTEGVRRIEMELGAIELRVAEELRRLEHRGTGTPAATTEAPATTKASIVKRDERDTLVAKAKTLEKKAGDEAKKLTAAGRKEDAATLEKEEAALQKLVKELTAATDAAEIKRLDTEVKASEKRLNDELHRLEGKTGAPKSTTTAASVTTKASIVKRDLKDDLLTKAAALEKQANGAIKKLKAEGNTAEVAVLEKEEANLKKLATELKAATDDAAIKRLDGEVKAIETKIAAEIRKATKGGSTKPPKVTTAATTAAPLVKRDLKSDLLDRAASLETRATADAKKLTDAGKATEAAHLEREVKELQKLATDLKAATAEPEVRRLETQLRAIETRVAEELRRIERGGGRTTAAPTTAGSF